MNGLDDRSFAAGQDFLLTLKTAWTTELFPRLREKALADLPADTAHHVFAANLESDPDYQVFAFLERHMQRLKYSGRYGIHMVYAATRREALARRLDPSRLPDGILELDPAFEQPAYYVDCDIHQHPGGVWSDPIAGAVYERGARSTTPLSGGRHRDLHDRLTDLALASGPRPSRVLDMGCGFGKSTRPFYEALRDDGEVVGVDLAGPCLMLAARDAADAQARNVRFLQRDCAATGLEGEAFDLVTSTMLLQEMPPEDVRATLREALRVLKPGGRMLHLDFWLLPDGFAEFIHLGHSRRNNEPYMATLRRMDLPAELAEAGFEAVTVEPFEEADGTLAPGYAPWRFPWTAIAAVKPAA